MLVKSQSSFDDVKEVFFLSRVRESQGFPHSPEANMVDLYTKPVAHYVSVHPPSASHTWLPELIDRKLF